MLEIRKISSRAWKHTVDSEGITLSKAVCDIKGNDFILSRINGQKPIDTFNVTQITLIDDTTSTTYPAFATGDALAIQLDALNYVGFYREGDVLANLNDISDVNITAPSNGQVLKYNDSTQLWENQDESGGGGGTGLITTGYTKATDFGNINFYPKAMFQAIPIQDDANTDIWLASTAVNQRVIHHFGEGVSLDKISYVNGTRSVDGSSVTFGAKTVTIYAITANIDPAFTYGVTDANYTQIFTGDFAQYTISQSKSPPELTLTNIPATTYALVYDIANNHTGDNSGRIEIRRLSAFKQ